MGDDGQEYLAAAPPCAMREVREVSLGAIRVVHRDVRSGP